MRKIKRIVLVVLLLLVVGGVVLYLSLDRIVKSQIQKHATSSLNLTTTLDSAHLSLFGGMVTLNQLQIASPPGCAAPQMLDLAKLDVAVKYSQLTSDPVHITSIVINKPHFVIEQVGGKMNFRLAMDLQPATTTPPPKVIIDQLDLVDAVVDVKLGGMVPGMKVSDVSVPIPTLTLKNIGNADGAGNGAAIKEAVMQVVTALAAKVSESGAVGKEMQAALKGNVAAVAGQLSSTFQQQLGGLTGTLGKVIPGDMGKHVGDVTKGATDGLGKALGGLTGSVDGKKDKDNK